jgi:hypothetical protein
VPGHEAKEHGPFPPRRVQAAIDRTPHRRIFAAPIPRRFAEAGPAETVMHTSVNEFLEEQTRGLTELVENLRKSRVAAAREAANRSAARIRALNGRVRRLASSGVRLNSISHGAVQGLIELQADIVTAALTDAGEQLRRLAETESVRDLARQQSDVLQATRQRIVDDVARAISILKSAASDVRKAAQPGGTRKPASRRKSARKGASAAAAARTRRPRKAAPKKSGGRVRRSR